MFLTSKITDEKLRMKKKIRLIMIKSWIDLWKKNLFHFKHAEKKSRKIKEAKTL